MALAHLPVSPDLLADFCRRHGIRRLALFGSVLRDDFGPESDVDVLVDYEPGERSFRATLQAKADLSALLGGREVDLIQRSSLNRWIRARVFAEEEVLYDQEGADTFGENLREPRSRRAPNMNERDVLYFGHMLDAAREALEIARDVDRTGFDTDRTLRLALTHLVQIVGEAARKVSAEGRAAHPEIPWQEMIGRRHVLVHNYEGVKEPKVWETVDEDLPALVAALEAFLPEPPA
jgi:uncharacterized protein with HEPN domain/predicted nucleotidyltransferase